MDCSKDNRQRFRRGLAVVLGAVSLMALAACGAKSTSAATADILTQKPVESGRMPITVLVKYAFSINAFEEAVEAKFPEIDIIQVGNYTRDMGIKEYERRLANDDLTDVVMTWPLDVGEEYWEERLLDLSGYDFTSRYNLSMLNSISRDGKLYYLPGPSQIRGIVYNKTLFEEKGWAVPKDYEGFLALCRQIEESGMRSLQLGFRNNEVLDTAFIGYNYASSYSKPQDVQWIADYNNGIGSFGDHFSGALDVFQEMIDAGIWKESDLDVGYAKRETLLFTRQCAMVEDSVLVARMGAGSTGSTDEFALMPFFNPGQDSDWARLYMVCYVGVNKNLTQPGNEEKLKLVMELMEYISTHPGQEALSADTGGMFSSLIGMPPPSVPEIQALLTSLGHGRYAVFPQLKNAQSALREGMIALLKGEASKEDVIAMVDAQNQSPLAIAPPEKLGTASEDFTMIETGNFVTDVMRDWSGCDVALFLDNGKDGLYNGKGISGSLYAGDVTEVDISCILPDLKHGEKGVVWKVSMTGADLKKTLEYSMPVENNRTGWFYYFSGLKMTYDPVAEPGTRIKSIAMEDGSAVEDETVYTVAVMDETLPEGVVKKCTETNTTISDILELAVQNFQTISPAKDGRFTIA